MIFEKSSLFSCSITITTAKLNSTWNKKLQTQKKMIENQYLHNASTFHLISAKGKIHKDSKPVDKSRAMANTGNWNEWTAISLNVVDRKNIKANEWMKSCRPCPSASLSHRLLCPFKTSFRWLLVMWIAFQLVLRQLTWISGIPFFNHGRRCMRDPFIHSTSSGSLLRHCLM